jgi:hypothetical protein
MPTWPKLFAASLLVAASVIAPACRRDPGSQARLPHDKGRTIVEKEPPKPRGMPRALPLPAKPMFAMHVANPGVALAALGSFAGLGNEPGAVLRALTKEVPAVLGPEIHDRLDPDRPWSAAIVENQVVIRVAVRRASVDEVERTLASKPKVGSFGAVELARPTEAVDLDPPPPRLAWLDSGSATLTLAGDERGLATGRELGGAYGKSGLFVTVDGAQIRKAVPEFPFDRVSLVGKDVGDFRITTEGNRPVEGLDDITEGALTGVLAFPELAAGATSRYAKHEAVVKGMISDASRMVEKQNFLVRGVLEDMLKRYKAVLRAWNGRVMGGVGAKGHVLLALGADDPKKAAGAATSLIDSVMDNLDLARTFGVSVPKLRFKRNRSIASGVSIHVLAFANARKQLPAELAGLLNGDGDLRIAFGGSEHSGAVMVAIGPDSPEVLTRWIEATKGATPGHKTRDQLLAAAIAVDADAIPGLRTGEIDMQTVLGLAADRAPTNIVATRKDGNFDIHVTGPIPKVAERRAPRMHPNDPRMRPGAGPRGPVPPRAPR